MFNHLFSKPTLLMPVVLFCLFTSSFAASGIQGKIDKNQISPSLVFAADASNDLYKAVKASAGAEVMRVDTPLQAVRAAAQGAGVVLVADGYPVTPLRVSDQVFTIAKEKRLKLYLEFPASGTAGLRLGDPVTNSLKRLVVHQDGVLNGLKKMHILDPHECVYVPVQQEIDSKQQWLTLAKVAGYDTAVYGYSGGANPTPAVFVHTDPKSGQDMLVATTGLSHVIRGRLAPTVRWHAFWESILNHYMQQPDGIDLQWTPLLSPMYAKDAPLPTDARSKAIERGIAWYSASRQLVHPDWIDVYNDRSRFGDTRVHQPWPERGLPVGDGSLGILEGTANPIYPDGTQAIRWLVRGDDVGEAAIAYALHAKLANDDNSKRIASNLMTYLNDSPLSSGAKSDPSSTVYGMRAWNASTNTNTFYSDDVARLQIGQLGVMGALQNDAWDELMATQILAMFRFTGTNGFWGQPQYTGTLDNIDWRELHMATPNPAARSHPHFEAYKLAPLLWLYGQTGHEPLLQRSKLALGHMVEALREGRIQWTNGVQQERARMIFPLAWLVRVDDTPEHRAWLKFVVDEVLKNQQPCGSIIEEVGGSGGQYPPPASNDAFGTTEAPVIQENGDPGVDLLYTTNFAFKGLIEAEAVMNDPKVTHALQKLTDFLVRVQVRSEMSELHGQWLRGFDFDKWDYWGSDSDLGWGVWGNQSGWTQSEIVAGLALVEMQTSLWDVAEGSTIENVFPAVHQKMFNSLAQWQSELQIKHAGIGHRAILAKNPDPRYPGQGAKTLTDGKSARLSNINSGWLGYISEDFSATIDLGEKMDIQSIGAGFMQSIPSGIYLPQQLELAVSTDGETFETVATIQPDEQTRQPARARSTLTKGELNLVARYLRVTAKNIGTIPNGNPGGGTGAWLFIDEILINADDAAHNAEVHP